MVFVPPGCEIDREPAARLVPRHRHQQPYAALVLRGGFVEAGDQGRFRVQSGDVLLHDSFEAHMDCFGRTGADLLNLALPQNPAFGFGHIDDADEIVRLAETDIDRAALRLLKKMRFADAPPADWPDLLASDLRNKRAGCLSAWADDHGLRPQSVSRGFRQVFGVSPQRYRHEVRAARAARALARGSENLAALAVKYGFADQPHLTRSIRRLFGTTPAALAVHCVQDSPHFHP